MRILLSMCLLIVAGCGFRHEPVLSHGKPASYWIDTLKSPNPRERKKAVEALGYIGPADSAAIPALIETVKDRDPTVRGQAILALLNIGPQAKEALPTLTEALNDPDARVRDYADKAVKRIQGAS